MLSVQVNFRTILKNVNTIKKQLKTGTRFCAVVKANAYGLGLERISKLLAPVVDCFAVATLHEGIKLRQIGIEQDILVFGICEDVALATKNNLIITVENIKQARKIVEENLHPRIHIAVNTGMNRFGITSVHELRETLQILSYEHVEGFYTHLAYESNNLNAVKNAIQHFKKLTHICQQYFPRVIVHAGCSGVIDYPPAHFDMMRIGKALYGGVHGTETAITVTSKIVTVKKVKPGSTVGYNGNFKTTQATLIGVIYGGYANGIPTQFSSHVNVLVEKTPCPIIGRICMDYCFVDVSHVSQPLGKRVTFLAPIKGQTLMDLSNQANMITCNLLLDICRSKIETLN